MVTYTFQESFTHTHLWYNPLYIQLIYKHTIFFITSFKNSLPWSIMIFMDGPWLWVVFIMAWATEGPLLSLSGYATTHFVYRSVIVRTYLLALSVTVNGPMRSIPSTSHFPSVLIGCNSGACVFIFLWNWHFRQHCIWNACRRYQYMIQQKLGFPKQILSFAKK